MRQPRRRRGFERAGTVPAERLGLSARRARELGLLQGWRRVAGETLAHHAPARDVVRGVLEVEATDRRWYDALEPLLPQLAARLAVEQPALGVKKFRLRLAGDGATPEARLVPEHLDPVAAAGIPSPVPRFVEPAARATPTRDDLERELVRVAARYLSRGDGQKA